MGGDIDKNYITQKAINALRLAKPNASASNINYLLFSTLFTIILVIFLAWNSECFIFFSHLIYFIQNMLKSFLFGKSCSSKYKGETAKFLDSKLPIYSILIPLYKEEKALDSIIDSITNLDYPINLLDVKLVLEEDDNQTISSLEKIKIPKYFEIIKVPFSMPRTKPKALNYAMQFIRGELVVIYDAEDRPEKDQLLKCVKCFAQLPEDIICLQAKLNFYNSNRNLLTRLFSMEYIIWFEYLLPSIDLLNLPLPLGGNSNHFKVSELKKIHMWDPYNVTEDADLGIRIYLENYRSKILDSYTFEEATPDFKNWISQRSRWIKGFIQTFLVFIRQLIYGRQITNVRSIIFITIFIGLSPLSFITIPLVFLISSESLLAYKIIELLNFFSTFIFMYFSVIYIVLKRNKRDYLDYLTCLIWPLYFLLHSIASYKSLYELIFKPFYWNKTQHFE